MRLGAAALLLLFALCALHACAALRIRVGASDAECFFEDLEEQQRVGVSYEVIEGGHLDIDVEVRFAFFCFLFFFLKK